MLSAVSAVYRNRIVVNNINKLQNINCDINGMISLFSLIFLGVLEYLSATGLLGLALSNRT